MSKNKSIEQLCKDKKIAFIPIYSMRDYKTGEYNLFADGNMSRIISKLYSTDFVSATIFIPNINDKEFEKLIKKVEYIVGCKSMKFVRTDFYGANAKETRDSLLGDVSFSFDKLFDSFDIIISEPNMLTYQMANSKLVDKLIYWCVASKTSQVCPWFVKDYEKIDKAIAKKCLTAVLVKNQVKYLKGKSFVDKNFYDPEIDFYHTIFFPFRLSDESYYAREVEAALRRVNKATNLKFKVLFTDPNSSGIFKEDNLFKKVSSDKDTYLSILKSKPLIIYLEDSDNMLHISIFEFLYYKCNIIMWKQSQFKKKKNIFEIQSIDDLDEAIIDVLYSERKSYE